MRKVFFYFILLYPTIILAQTDHWESVITEGDEWRYIVPTSEPDPSWINLSYSDTSWEAGISGFGYGDGDDNTILEQVTSVYIRKVFSAINKSTIEKVFFFMDYDDAFVAYLNGSEVARGHISGNPPTFDQFSDDLHEALLKDGLLPEKFELDTGLLLQGENVLSVQIHNQGSSSSDFSAIPFLIVGVTNDVYDYSAIPTWFQPPAPPLEAFSSNLPIIVINTDGQTIENDPKVLATFSIIYNGPDERTDLNDPPNEYVGFCGIELRGESSLWFDKKSYGIEIWDEYGLDQDASFLNFPEEEDFILYGPYSDKSLLNNVMAMKLGQDLSQYASRTRFVELVINEEYLGLYVIMEKIKKDGNRLDIASLNLDEVSGDDLTGGYIVRIDKGNYDGWSSKYFTHDGDYNLYFQYYYPDQTHIRTEQKQYIEGYVHDFEDALKSPNHKNSKDKHYTEYINLRSFVDNFIINEISKNVDAYRLSTYFYKDKDSKGGKLTAGPLWDFNLAFGNGDYCGGDITTGWEYYQCSGNSPFWWHSFLQDTLFTNALKCRWEELRATKLNTDTINHYLDSMALLLNESQQRNFDRWQIMGIYLWPNSQFYANSTSHNEVMGHMKNWIEQRSVWMDNNLPGIARDCQLYESYGIETPLGIGFGNDDILIFPNPTSGIVNISSQKPFDRIMIRNVLGQVVFSEILPTHVFNMRIQPELPCGTYFIEIQEGNLLVRKKLMIR